MDVNEFKRLREICDPCTPFRMGLGNGHTIEVGVCMGQWFIYAAELDRLGNFVASRTEHPFARGVLRTLQERKENGPVC